MTRRAQVWGAVVIAAAGALAVALGGLGPDVRGMNLTGVWSPDRDAGRDRGIMFETVVGEPAGTTGPETDSIIGAGLGGTITEDAE